MLLRGSLFATLAGMTACSLLVDTGDLGGGSAASGAETGTGIDVAQDAGPAGAGDDAGDAPATVDAKTFPPTATVWTNGHAYEVVQGSFTWEAAEAAARGRGGHLVTLGSAEENEFVFGLVLAVQPGAATQFRIGPYIGARQAPGGAEPGDGWAWVTGEPWSYTAWGATEPNDDDGDDVAAYFGGPQWADILSASLRAPGYVVEYEP